MKIVLQQPVELLIEQYYLARTREISLRFRRCLKLLSKSVSKMHQPAGDGLANVRCDENFAMFDG